MDTSNNSKKDLSNLKIDTKQSEMSWSEWIWYLLLNIDPEDGFPKGKVVVEKSDGQFEKLVAPSADSRRMELDHPLRLALFTMYNIAGFYGAYHFLTAAKIPTMIFAMFTLYLSMIGITAGAHRLWSHRAYKAKYPLEALLIFCFLLANQRPIVAWVRYHRLHHRCSDTDADPHNSARGFVYAHFGWVITKPHPEFLKRKNSVNLSDLANNPLVRFEEKYVVPLMLLLSHVLPSMIPMLWGESFSIAHSVNLFRLIVALHLINLVNSAAHLLGYKPVDTTVAGTQFPFVGAVTFGEGFHNYHHTFPYDYRASELGDTKLNLTTRFINFFAKIGWAYDLKTPSEEIVRNRVAKKGDGTDLYYLPNNEGKQKFICLTFFEKKPIL